MVINDVLIVDDSPTMRTLISFSLALFENMSYREASNGIEALEAIARSKPDLMVVDINMPEMNGIELISAVRADDKITPIVVVTTQGSDEDVRRGLQAGATEYLIKPFQPQKLQTIIRRLQAK